MPQMTMAESLNLALDQSMAADDAVCVIGEDIGVNGGVFRITKGLLEKYGEDRGIETRLAENALIAAAVGMALYGLEPRGTVVLYGGSARAGRCAAVRQRP